MLCPNVTKSKNCGDTVRLLKICYNNVFNKHFRIQEKKFNSQKFRSHFKYAYSCVTYGSICSLTENVIIKESVIFSLIPIETPCRVHYALKNSTCSIPSYFWTFRNFLLKNLHRKVYQNVIDACGNIKLKYHVSI